MVVDRMAVNFVKGSTRLYYLLRSGGGGDA